MIGNNTPGTFFSWSSVPSTFIKDESRMLELIRDSILHPVLHQRPITISCHVHGIPPVNPFEKLLVVNDVWKVDLNEQLSKGKKNICILPLRASKFHFDVVIRGRNELWGFI